MRRRYRCRYNDVRPGRKQSVFFVFLFFFRPIAIKQNCRHPDDAPEICSSRRGTVDEQYGSRVSSFAIALVGSVFFIFFFFMYVFFLNAATRAYRWSVDKRPNDRVKVASRHATVPRSERSMIDDSIDPSTRREQSTRRNCRCSDAEERLKHLFTPLIQSSRKKDDRGR